MHSEVGQHGVAEAWLASGKMEALAFLSGVCGQRAAAVPTPCSPPHPSCLGGDTAQGGGQGRGGAGEGSDPAGETIVGGVVRRPSGEMDGLIL